MLRRLNLADVRPLDWYGISSGELAAACAVTARTAERWKADKAMPATAELCWRMRQGELGLIDASFNGFTLARGLLWTVNNASSVTSGQVEALPITTQLVQDAQRRLREAADERRMELRRADERRAAALSGGFQATCGYALPMLRPALANAPAVVWGATGATLPPPRVESLPAPPPAYARHKRNGARVPS